MSEIKLVRGNKMEHNERKQGGRKTHECWRGEGLNRKRHRGEAEEELNLLKFF